MFSTGLLVSAGATITIALVEKTLDDLGYLWIGTILRIAIPLASMLLGVYFLEHNPILRWLR
jgi:hypothetical protein